MLFFQWGGGWAGVFFWGKPSVDAKNWGGAHVTNIAEKSKAWASDDNQRGTGQKKVKQEKGEGVLDGGTVLTCSQGTNFGVENCRATRVWTGVPSVKKKKDEMKIGHQNNKRKGGVSYSNIDMN